MTDELDIHRLVDGNTTGVDVTKEEFWSLGDLGDAELEEQLPRILSAGARLEARLVAHLAELDGRKLHAKAGFSSLYKYCRTRLGLSDFEAFSRIAAARAARRFPVIFGMLERRELTLTTICEIREFLTEENHRELLAAVTTKTKLQVREVIAAWFPRADVAASTREMPSWDPLSPGRYKLEVTLSAEQKDKLEYARDLLGHAERAGDLARVLERALDALIPKLERARLGGSVATQVKPKRVKPRKNLRVRRAQPPRAVRREVVARDEGRCTFVAADGHRCNSRARLEFHHRQPWALGGEETADNLLLFCQTHNRLVAELELGQDHVEEAIARRRRSRSGDTGELAPPWLAKVPDEVISKHVDPTRGRLTKA